jgi:hypothetical protein
MANAQRPAGGALDGCEAMNRLTPVITVFGSRHAREGDRDYVEALELGHMLALAGYDVMSGGYAGTMEAVSRGTKDAGGRTRGITMSIFDPAPANQWVDDEEKVLNFFIRLEKLIYDADAYIVLRGGIGTLTEVGLTWSLLQTKQIPPKPLVFIGEAWARMFDAFRQDCIITPQDYELVTLVRSPAEAVAHLKQHLR